MLSCRPSWSLLWRRWLLSKPRASLLRCVLCSALADPPSSKASLVLSSRSTLVMPPLVNLLLSDSLQNFVPGRHIGNPDTMPGFSPPMLLACRCTPSTPMAAPPLFQTQVMPPPTFTRVQTCPLPRLHPLSLTRVLWRTCKSRCQVSSRTGRQ